MAADEDIAWYTGLLILVPMLPLFVYMIWEPFLALIGAIDEFLIPAVSWNRVILNGVVLAGIIYVVTMMEHHVVGNPTAPEHILFRSKLLVSVLLIAYYGTLAYLFALVGQTGTVANIAITLGLLLVIVHVLVGRIVPLVDDLEPRDSELPGENSQIPYAKRDVIQSAPDNEQTK